MNLIRLKEIIEAYKFQFSNISKEELYKWEAVKTFQNNWDIDADDFAIMLLKSFKTTKNLLDSGQYFPRRMLINVTNKRPEIVRELFRHLYNEDNDLISRIENFQAKFNQINTALFGDKKSYQDDRAVIVYLCLKFPNRYFLYKYEMFKSFAQKVNYDYIPKKGKKDNIIQYLTLCNLVREELSADNSLIRIHADRIKPQHFYDTSLNILTQDVIYASVKHIRLRPTANATSPVNIQVVNSVFTAARSEPKLRGRFVNYIENERVNKRLGDLGELLILEYEKKFLLDNGIIDLFPIHASKNVGDGLGYDILSFTLDRQPKYIEVKTTNLSAEQPFFITTNELVRSVQNQNTFYLYRLYDFNYANRSGKLIIIKGNLTRYCVNPTNYKVLLIGLP